MITISVAVQHFLISCTLRNHGPWLIMWKYLFLIMWELSFSFRQQIMFISPFSLRMVCSWQRVTVQIRFHSGEGTSIFILVNIFCGRKRYSQAQCLHRFDTFASTELILILNYNNRSRWIRSMRFWLIKQWWIAVHVFHNLRTNWAVSDFCTACVDWV